MKILIFSVVLFLMGVIEYFLSDYKNLISVRLQIFSTVVVTQIKRHFEFVVSLCWLAMGFDFFNEWKNGHFNLLTMLPYLFYLQGSVLGTYIALKMFKSKKKKNVRLVLEKARLRKKQHKPIKDEILIEIIEEVVEDMDLDKDVTNEVTEELKIEEELKNITKIKSEETNNEATKIPN